MGHQLPKLNDIPAFETQRSKTGASVSSPKRLVSSKTSTKIKQIDDTHICYDVRPTDTCRCYLEPWSCALFCFLRPYEGVSETKCHWYVCDENFFSTDVVFFCFRIFIILYKLVLLCVLYVILWYLVFGQIVLSCVLFSAVCIAIQ